MHTIAPLKIGHIRLYINPNSLCKGICASTISSGVHSILLLIAFAALRTFSTDSTTGLSHSSAVAVNIIISPSCVFSSYTSPSTLSFSALDIIIAFSSDRIYWLVDVSV